jgi:hypothetical protein
MISRISLVSKEAEAMDTTFQKTVVISIQVGQESKWDCQVLGELRRKQTRAGGSTMNVLKLRVKLRMNGNSQHLVTCFCPTCTCLQLIA